MSSIKRTLSGESHKRSKTRKPASAAPVVTKAKSGAGKWQRLMSDEDGHWYLIPSEKTARFNELLYRTDPYEELFAKEFGEMRLDAGPYAIEFLEARGVE